MVQYNKNGQKSNCVMNNSTHDRYRQKTAFKEITSNSQLQIKLYFKPGNKTELVCNDEK